MLKIGKYQGERRGLPLLLGYCLTRLQAERNFGGEVFHHHPKPPCMLKKEEGFWCLSRKYLLFCPLSPDCSDWINSLRQVIPEWGSGWGHQGSKRCDVPTLLLVLQLNATAKQLYLIWRKRKGGVRFNVKFPGQTLGAEGIRKRKRWGCRGGWGCCAGRWGLNCVLQVWEITPALCPGACWVERPGEGWWELLSKGPWSPGSAYSGFGEKYRDPKASGLQSLWEHHASLPLQRRSLPGCSVGLIFILFLL